MVVASPQRAIGVPASSVGPANQTQALLWLGALYLLVMFGRFCDYFLVGLKLPSLFTLLAAGTVLLAQGLPYALRTMAGRCVVGLILWIPVTIPMSFWRGQSLETYKTFLIHVVIFFVLAGLPRSVSDIKILHRALCASGLLLLGMAALKGVYLEERLFLPGGMFANANDLGMVILISGCLWSYFLRSPHVPVPMRFVVFGVIGLHCIMMLRTGSRGAMLGVAVTVIYSVAKLSGAARFKTIMAIGVLAALSLPFISTTLMNRFATIGESITGNITERNEASDSFNSRWLFLKDSLYFTATHPLFGIGPGTFAAYWGNDKEEQGYQVRYNVNHNAYLQISSETGLPGLMLFLGVHFFTFRNIKRAVAAARQRRFPGWERIDALGSATGGAMMAYTVTSFFLSIGYLMPLYLIAGLGAALHNVTETMVKATNAQAAAQPVPSPAQPLRRNVGIPLPRPVVATNAIPAVERGNSRPRRGL